MYVCAGESEQFDFATPIGIGLVDAAINATRLCLERQPTSLVFIGTAGSYGSAKIFDIVESRTASNIENGFYDGKTYTPIDTFVSFAEDVSRETIINSSTYITQDTVSAQQYLDQNIRLENMEFYAVLKVAKSFGILARGIFVVTNYCDPNAHDDFLSHHAEAKRRLTEFIRRDDA
jgi:nucleoside phosphorylase